MSDDNKHPDNMICARCGNYLPGYEPGDEDFDGELCACKKCAVCDENVAYNYRCGHDVRAACFHCDGNCHEQETCPKRPKCPKCEAFLNECNPAGDRCDHCRGKCHASIACPERPKCARCHEFYDVCHGIRFRDIYPGLSCARCWGSCHKKEECRKPDCILARLPKPEILKLEPKHNPPEFYLSELRPQHAGLQHAEPLRFGPPKRKQWKFEPPAPDPLKRNPALCQRCACGCAPQYCLGGGCLKSPK